MAHYNIQITVQEVRDFPPAVRTADNPTRSRAVEVLRINASARKLSTCLDHALAHLETHKANMDNVSLEDSNG